MLRWGEHYVRYLQFLVTSTKDAASAIGRLLPGAAPSSAQTLVNPASGASGLFQVVPDPGTRLRYGYNVDLPEQNIAAGDIVLSPDNLAAIEAVFPPGAAAGPRYRDMTNIHV